MSLAYGCAWHMIFIWPTTQEISGGYFITATRTNMTLCRAFLHEYIDMNYFRIASMALFV
jgi:hypothetical protein